MVLHIDKNRTNNIDNDSLQDTIVNNFDFEMVNKVFKRTLGSQLINVKQIVMKVDYSESM